VWSWIHYSFYQLGRGDFDLVDEFRSLAEELEPFGFKDVGEDSDLLLRCCAAIISNDASHDAIMNMKGDEIRRRFKEIRNGVLGAIDYLRSSLKVQSADSLPFASAIIPLSVFFSTKSEQGAHADAQQNKIINRWL
jgi:hypothetical protein